MRPFVENFPFFCIFLALLTGIVSAALRGGRFAYPVTVVSSAVIAGLSSLVLLQTLQSGMGFSYTMGRLSSVYGNVLWCGPLQALLATAFSVILPLCLIGGRRDLICDVAPERQGGYFAMVNLLEAGLLVLLYTNDVFTGYVFVEINTIAACALVMAKDTGSNLVAAIRYLFISLMGSGLFLVGLAFLNGTTGYLLMPVLGEAVATLRLSGTSLVTLTVAAGLMIAGLGIKSAMFPFHLWLPGAHGGATTASSAILSGLVLKGYIAFLLTLMVRVFSLEFLSELGADRVILIFGLLGMVFGSLGAIREHHIKRMLAYSTVAQIGYIYMGLGLGTTAGIAAACFHMLTHACCKPLLFLCTGRLSAVSGHHKSLKNLRGSAYRDLLAGLGFTVGALSMIGIPLFGGFASKVLFANAALDTNEMPLVLMALAISTVLNALYYVPALLSIWLKPSAGEAAQLPADLDAEPCRPDGAFALSAACLIAGVFALGILYHPISGVIEMGIRLL